MMKKIMILLLTAILMVSGAGAVPDMIEDFNHPNGAINQFSYNNHGFVYNTAQGSGDYCDYVNNEGYCSTEQNQAGFNKTGYGGNYIIEFDSKWDDNSAFNLGGGLGTQWGIKLEMMNGGNVNYNPDNGGATLLGAYLEDTWYHFTILVDETARNVTIWVDDDEYSGFTWSNNLPTGYFLQSEGGSSIWFDNITIDSPCTPDWSCSGYSECLLNEQECDEVTDLNACGEVYGGDYSEFSLQSCSLFDYGEEDIAGASVDTIVKFILSFGALVVILVFAMVGGYLIKASRGGKK